MADHHLLRGTKRVDTLVKSRLLRGKQRVDTLEGRTGVDTPLKSTLVKSTLLRGEHRVDIPGKSRSGENKELILIW